MPSERTIMPREPTPTEDIWQICRSARATRDAALCVSICVCEYEDDSHQSVQIRQRCLPRPIARTRRIGNEAEIEVLASKKETIFKSCGERSQSRQ